ncbi:methyl-accepting chemotaxis protein [Usitatibacter palustris]|uniref:methyl-accepting chemotaxis protein n=1 Tax=Usitatibacter palustris TaxID=2732487 RepID=UPI001488DCB7|nr:methyl-accepting chemotaxis protein [Usitatibacter palustris]
MKFILSPGISLMYRISNRVKMPLASFLYLMPLVILYADVGSQAMVGTRIAIWLFVIAAIYVMICWYVQATLGFKHLTAMIVRLANGDLTSGEQVQLGGSFQNLLTSLLTVNGNLGGIVSSVRGTADKLAGASGEIASAGAHLTERTEQQASTLEETASAMEELARTVGQNADSCGRASVLARGAEDVARRGASAVHGLVEGMERIDVSSRRMGEITGVIQGIAFQTNILALNAAVEAARAGEQGRGFAVVASEVRTLAQRSADAAKEIKALIDKSNVEVRDGNRRAAEAGKVIDDIVASVHEAAQLMGQVALASSQQSTGVTEINRAVVLLDGIAQQNAALAQEGLQSARSLQGQADAMRMLVQRFKIDEATTDVTIEPRSVRSGKMLAFQPGR